MTPKEFLDILEENDKYIVVEFHAYINKDDTIGMKVNINDGDGFWFETSFSSKYIEEKLVKIAVEESDWVGIIGELPSGLYKFKVVLTVEKDWDDYRSWYWYNVEHATTEFICSLEDELKKMEEWDHLTSSDFDFNII